MTFTRAWDADQIDLSTCFLPTGFQVNGSNVSYSICIMWINQHCLLGDSDGEVELGQIALFLNLVTARYVVDVE